MLRHVRRNDLGKERGECHKSHVLVERRNPVGIRNRFPNTAISDERARDFLWTTRSQPKEEEGCPQLGQTAFKRGVCVQRIYPGINHYIFRYPFIF